MFARKILCTEFQLA